MLPIIGYKITFSDLLSGIATACDRNIYKRCREELRHLIPSKNIYLVNSGTTACYVLLEVLKAKSLKKDVILPAYTSSHLVLAIQKCGLNPILCDMEQDGFNLYTDASFDVLGQKCLSFSAIRLLCHKLSDT